MLKNYIEKFIKALLGEYSQTTWWLIYSGLILCLVCGKIGYLNPIINFLDSDLLTLKFATVSFSVYKVLKSAILLVVFFWAAKALCGLVENNLKKVSQINASNLAILAKISQIFIYFIFLIIILDLHGMDLSAFAFLGGAVGIGIGFGLQKITSNFISGLILLFERSIKEGDLIEISTDVYGYIKRTGVRHTLVEKFNGQEIMIPNDEFITNRVTNWTHSNNRGRIDIKIGISYDSDIEKAMDIMVTTAKEHKNSSKSIEPKCYLLEFTGSEVELILFLWVDNIANKRLETKSDIMCSIWTRFKASDIIIPFPQYDVHIKK
jgi:small-conductance mechanosensitive channel